MLVPDASIAEHFAELEDPWAEHLIHAARSHWGVENSLHWILDVAMGEDDSRIRKGNAPENVATLRRLALNLLKQE